MKLAQLSPRELHQMAWKIRMCSKDQRDLLIQTEQIFSALGGSWMGPALNVFARQFDSMCPALIQFAAMLEAYAEALDQAAIEL